MSESESSPTKATPAPVKKRSPIERAAVWGGIVALLIVVYMEWNSRQGFDAARVSLDTAIHKTENDISAEGMPLAEVPNHVKGYATRAEETTGDVKKITYQWSSLFKVYKLILTVNDKDKVILVETYGAKDEAK